MTLEILIRRVRLDSPSPLLKQSPTLVLFLFGAAMVAVTPDWLSVPSALVAASIVAVVTTLLAALLSVRPSLQRFVLVVPALDFVAIGLLLFATGENRLGLMVLLILPIIWFAAEDGREYIWFAFVGTAVVLLFPSVAGVSSSTTAAALLRTGFTAVVFTIAAAVINELSRQARLRVASLRQLAEARKVALESSLAQTQELAASAAKLRRAERLFRGVWESVTEHSVIGSDITGMIELWNPGAAKMLGLPAEEAEHKRHIDEFHLEEELEGRARELNYPAGATVLNPGFSALVESSRLGNAEVREWTYVRPDGRHIPVELSVTPRIDDEGETVGYLFVAYDMTKAREVARLKDEFVGLISHELRTPLSSILGYLELMRDDDDDELSATQLQYLAVAERNANRLLTLVGDLLFTAQVESGKFNLESHVQSVAPILAAAIDTARPAAAAAGVSLMAEISETDESVMVLGDSVRLGQACDNLISNAIKFTSRGGAVTVAMSSIGSEVAVRVTDTGLGIAEAELEKLFTRFFRATTATRNAVPGVGLGLAITRAIVTAHGGDMSVTSEEGVGTTFVLTLPTVEKAVA
ncbi:MAG: hypothetical protein JWL94_324 [Microbacteriaceae bacterium]|nr:hypothetical protein [Microbacteriaceae bacterium]HEV7956746.1 ATP-binding protein [Marisediminicola sp.]